MRAVRCGALGGGNSATARGQRRALEARPGQAAADLARQNSTLARSFRSAWPILTNNRTATSLLREEASGLWRRIAAERKRFTRKFVWQSCRARREQCHGVEISKLVIFTQMCPSGLPSGCAAAVNMVRAPEAHGARGAPWRGWNRCPYRFRSAGSRGSGPAAHGWSSASSYNPASELSSSRQL